MASAQNSVLDPQTKVIQHNHVIIKYQQLSGAQSLPLGAMTHLDSKTNTEQSVQPPETSKANRIIEIETYNIYSVNKVLLQQILETIGQITKKALNKNPQQVMKLEPLALELYRQLTCFLFNLEAEENRKTGQISIQPEVQLLVMTVWNDIWRTLEAKK